MRAILFLLLFLGAVCGQQPSLSHTLFTNLPARLVYFDDSPVVLYHDTVDNRVWRSQDEGKSWDVITLPKDDRVAVVELSEGDETVAYILTEATTHYTTKDRGASWTPFETTLPPAYGTPLSFHAKHADWILYKGRQCSAWGICEEQTFYTLDGFKTAPKLLMAHSHGCVFAHERKEFALTTKVDERLVFCIASDMTGVKSGEDGSKSGRSLPERRTTSDKLKSGLKDFLDSLGSLETGVSANRLYSSTDFFESDVTFVDLGIGKDARGVVGIGAVKKFLVAALKPSTSPEMVLYVSLDGVTWTRGVFPHGRGLQENGYTIVESSQHALIVDVNTDPTSNTGTLYVSNSDGTHFVQSLEHTNRNRYGVVDFEKLQGIEGVAFANTVANPGAPGPRQLRSQLTFDDGHSWAPLTAPAELCAGGECTLHLHSVSQPHNFGKVFSSTAPGLVMGVGSVGSFLRPYDECDTFLSTDGGVSWRKVAEGAHKYEFGDQGGLLVLINDEEPVDELLYSTDHGLTFQTLELDVKVRTRLLTTIPDSTSLKFLLLGTLTRRASEGTVPERHVLVYIDFDTLKKRKCAKADFEKWYVGGPAGAQCLLGHKQWFMRRRAEADCFVHEKYKDPVGRAEDCTCTDADFECDFNFAPDPNSPGTCIPAGPEAIPDGSCVRDTDTFLGSSGYRRISGDTCKGGVAKDAPVTKPCHAGQSTPGIVTHATTSFPGLILDHAYFPESHTVLVHTSAGTLWQSSNEGRSWTQPIPGLVVTSFLRHAYSHDRAYALTGTDTVHYTTDKGRSWHALRGPTRPNSFGVPVLDFHPLQPDWLIWAGEANCDAERAPKCRGVAYYSKDNGRKWFKIDEYTRVCTWARDKRLRLDERTILCETHRDRRGDQRSAGPDNPLELYVGDKFYGTKRLLFGDIVGFATFDEYMAVAAAGEAGAVNIEVSLDARHFARAQFPPDLHIRAEAYTVLESSTGAIFLLVSTHPNVGSEWGTLFKSNSNGTYYSPSLQFVNRNARGFVDFEKVIGLDGIALANVVANPQEAAQSSHKRLRSLITHNDGGRWKTLTPPARDALGAPYACTVDTCSLHIHGYTERRDPRATYSSPSSPGILLAVGNVGTTLAAYADSDTFLSRDGGFTWDEVRKDAHMWEFGDQGSIILLANDEDATDHVVYSLDMGLTWNEYALGQRIRITSIATVPMDTSRKFILFGVSAEKTDSAIAIHVDFSGVTNEKCVLDLAHPEADDFELWSPSERREEQCLFGRQTFYHRRIRDRNCYVGERLPQPHSIAKTCACTEEDFECEFNYFRNDAGRCVLLEGASPLAADASCARYEQPYWYERTAYRKIPYSTCTGGLQLDRGTAHACPNYVGSGWFSYLLIIIGLSAAVGGAAYVYQTRGGFTGGRIRLPDAGDGHANATLERLASVPAFLAHVGQIALQRARDVAADLPSLGSLGSTPFAFRRRSSYAATGPAGYRTVHLDEDAELLDDYNDDDDDDDIESHPHKTEPTPAHPTHDVGDASDSD